jgi:glycosyltransferase involved in cell wall biosynthesis
VVVVVHEMRREAVRTLQSLRADYQLDMRPDDYEVLVIENGSREPLDAASVEALGPNVKYRYLENAPASPARAINVGVSQSSGEVIAIMIDGACLLSPGVLSTAMRAYACFERPVVLTRYFYLGPGRQNDTIPGGYNRKVEDALLASIRWPEDPYRLFEIASPLTVEGPRENWFTPWFESNCLFMPRDLFEEIGGCEERFDLPGGGAANIDLFARAGSHEESHLVQLIGEGVFHQVHGGITTNVSPAARDEMIRDATAQYERIRGNVEPVCRKRVHYIGQLAVAAARSKMDG